MPARPTARRIDLHTHSTASDGTTPPAELVREAREAGLDVVALTDHDTTAGHAEALAALPAGLTLVRGTELSCVSGDISLHLLGYLFDPAEPEFAQVRADLRASRVGRAETMARRLEAAGTGVTWQRVQELAGGTVGRPHVAQALIEAGCVGTIAEAFTPEWIGADGRFWAPKVEVDVVEGVRLVVAAGGVPVFAHPAASKRGRTVADSVVEQMAEAGLAGLEVDHVDHDEAARAHLRDLASALGLFTTGSSDYHGTNKTIPLGAHLTSEASCAAILERATGLPAVTG